MKSREKKEDKPVRRGGLPMDGEEVMKPHYDFSKGEKPNYAKRFPDGAIVTVTATELRKLPKAKRKRIIKQQFILGGKMYSGNTDLIIPASHKTHD